MAAQVSRAELMQVVKDAIAASGRADLTFELDPAADYVDATTQWWLAVCTPSDEVDMLVTRDGMTFARENEHGYFDDVTEQSGLSEVLRKL
jgi:hypothetical protein